MSDTGIRQRLEAILAADAAGYSRLMAADEPATVAALDVARGIFKAQIESHQGRVIDMAGDSVLAVFETAAGAVTAALAVQQELDASASSVPENRRMRFRIGVHLGDVIEKPDGTVYGDGVNIASRLERLAKPGGVNVSDAVKTALRGKVHAIFEDQGEQTVKNIAEPVRAYALRLGPEGAASAALAPAPPRRLARRAAVIAGIALLIAVGVTAWFAPWRSRVDTAPAEQSALAIPAKPSIAVLPFENMSGDPEQAYFADGMTEDLITDLSKVAGLLVIARNSTFAYKGKAKDVREIAKALGVRYVLEGSVRRSGGEIRVNAQLIDATTGGHVWADRYDGDMKSIFGLQDKVTRNVVSALAVELTKDDRARVARRGTENAQAYDVFLKGWQHYLRQTPEDFRAAIDQFKMAVEMDPKYGRAYAALAATYWEIYTRYWGFALGLRGRHDARVRAEQFLAKAMDDPTPLAHEVASAMLLHAQQHDEAISEAKRAIASDPNDADGYVALAGVLSFTGRAPEALELVERAIRLNPHYPPQYLYQRGLAQFGMNRLEDAATALQRAITVNPDDYWSQRLLLATYGLLGRGNDASKLLEAIKSKDRRGLEAYADPITITAMAFWHPFASPVDAARFADGLRKAGVPE
ncbi:MAG: adenylate/guanylate cyclase domain-containing protein [Betaproteobacteria bacterium]|nr:adenylate/guanylate cyclase domain-containing protein [Betaproteobacteria bacterium]